MSRLFHCVHYYRCCCSVIVMICQCKLCRRPVYAPSSTCSAWLQLLANVRPHSWLAPSCATFATVSANATYAVLKSRDSATDAAPYLEFNPCKDLPPRDGDVTLNPLTYLWQRREKRGTCKLPIGHQVKCAVYAILRTAARQAQCSLPVCWQSRCA